MFSEISGLTLKRSIITLLAWIAAGMACSLPAAAQQPRPRQPNVILIMTDDQGYGEIAAHGNPTIKTPHLDRLHAASVRLTNFHVDPTCSPTRTSVTAPAASDAPWPSCRALSPFC